MSFVAKKVGRKMFAGQAAAMEPTDPHYETYQDDRGKTHSRKRAMPEGLSKKDRRILRSVRRRAHYLDKGFSLCGFRFGWTAIFGLIPFLGDIIGFLISYSLVLKKCRQADVQSRMVFNQMVGSGVGMIPLVGDIILAVWKANSRNALLLEDYLIAKSKTGASPESAGQEALSIAAMSGKTGERPGERHVSGDFAPDSPEASTPTYGATAVKGTSSSGAAVSASTRRADAQPKKYGWGSSGTKNLNEDQRPLTQASDKNGQASRTA
ncbi:BZ3500_MvSof-1268-A1-R1_Chr3-3g06401 [Microbotryum saponariae]|uniref:BZ3500_MvSof-1268-A1-R1_Chr3-3g06401 protein n=1 Tax=Microbotryum saponariae TaxID=289078 RepID=A0A2X0LH81_9BASI|nr:BZ3500_MvSof-1268-A1-R1_Chr3-3g06401 [Microbotryum saponariae]SDA04368.1 BZ3501_MvSof-1269-A2-R1_Chr3-2g06088 [Microbotryum saponariae]